MTAPGPTARILHALAARGLPADKAHYLWRLTAPEMPEFPLGPEVENMVPDDLPGTLPTSIEAFLDAIKR